VNVPVVHSKEVKTVLLVVLIAPNVKMPPLVKVVMIRPSFMIMSAKIDVQKVGCLIKIGNVKNVLRMNVLSVNSLTCLCVLLASQISTNSEMSVIILVQMELLLVMNRNVKSVPHLVNFVIV